MISNTVRWLAVTNKKRKLVAARLLLVGLVEVVEVETVCSWFLVPGVVVERVGGYVTSQGSGIVQDGRMIPLFEAREAMDYVA